MGSNREKLIEIVLDLGRRPEGRFATGPEYLSQKVISWQDIDYIIKRISKFSGENRAGIERTLHRISCIRNRQFLINGLTCGAFRRRGSRCSPNGATDDRSGSPHGRVVA